MKVAVVGCGAMGAATAWRPTVDSEERPGAPTARASTRRPTCTSRSPAPPSLPVPSPAPPASPRGRAAPAASAGRAARTAQPGSAEDDASRDLRGARFKNHERAADGPRRHGHSSTCRRADAAVQTRRRDRRRSESRAHASDRRWQRCSAPEHRRFRWRVGQLPDRRRSAGSAEPARAIQVRFRPRRRPRRSTPEQQRRRAAHGAWAQCRGTPRDRGARKVTARG